MLDWISQKESWISNCNTNYEIKLEKLKELPEYDSVILETGAFRLSECSADISSVNRAVTFGYETYKDFKTEELELEPKLKILDISKGKMKDGKWLDTGNQCQMHFTLFQERKILHDGKLETETN